MQVEKIKTDIQKFLLDKIIFMDFKISYKHIRNVKNNDSPSESPYKQKWFIKCNKIKVKKTTKLGVI